MARLQINLDSEVPVYRQIVDGIRILLVEGKLAPGSELPPVRRIALDLGIHFNTVAEAYRILADEGWLDLRHGRGATVLRRDTPLAANAGRVQEFRHRLRALIAEIRSQGASAAKLSAELRSLADELKHEA
ncbi:MAG TPA: GntR family transcriptional regulator [Candidatus Binatia bacterium]|nr:GntR family transcriptional regulator [Candidatus Binatia bacterium]